MIEYVELILNHPLGFICLCWGVCILISSIGKFLNGNY